MQSQTSGNSGFNKLKTILFLGLSCNYTTLVGCITVWVFLQHFNLVSDWFKAGTITLSVMPFFMGDAVNAYVLGRIKLEHKNDWNDIKIVFQEKERIANFYSLYRGISILTSYGAVALIICHLGKISIPKWSIILLAVVGILHLSRCLLTIIKGIAPIITSYKKPGTLYRVIFLLIISLLWYYLFTLQNLSNLNNMFVFISGILYFILCGTMHPLPSNGSLISSILRDSIISAAQAQASADNDPALAYTNKAEDIEDASIVTSNETDSTIKSETLYYTEVETENQGNTDEQ